MWIITDVSDLITAGSVNKKKPFKVFRRKDYLVLTNEEDKLKPVSMMSRVFVCYMDCLAIRPTLSFV